MKKIYTFLIALFFCLHFSSCEKDEATMPSESEEIIDLENIDSNESDTNEVDDEDTNDSSDAEESDEDVQNTEENPEEEESDTQEAENPPVSTDNPDPEKVDEEEQSENDTENNSTEAKLIGTWNVIDFSVSNGKSSRSFGGRTSTSTTEITFKEFGTDYSFLANFNANKSVSATGNINYTRVTKAPLKTITQFFTKGKDYFGSNWELLDGNFIKTTNNTNDQQLFKIVNITNTEMTLSFDMSQTSRGIEKS
ncbi:hypothetical protein [Aquimarina agarivorans]|uniref:hypothetical protein n=1 Tax=Aquimarina agarivorans TaxID=980584 RepID=UPI000248EA6A|nr:hypothetical protein [Aquimarina agarivorans]